ncbi:bacteriohemerythrin [Desulfovibrio inopinatus]|uniref:bacteriohemerythrin n=1 Tax=Desulfovibrio inopinatus TaxID=102109 RepID=UPI00040EC0C0|nr:bacteriohemerythrin [Desulfovibrio inopinatus]
MAVEIAENVHETSESIGELGELAVQLGELICDMKTSGDDSLVTWNSTLGVGVRQIDEQHMVLVELLNSLYAAMKSGQGEAVLSGLLDDLVQYTVYHFDTEEKLMDRYSYPDKPAHRKEHEALKKQVADFVEQFKSGKVPMSNDILHFLKSWVVNHIKRSDKRYGPFFNQKGLV